MRKLARGPQRIMAGPAIVLGDRRARFHRIADQPVVDEAETRHMRGLLERRRDGGLVAELPVAAEIVGHVVEQLRCARTNGFEHADDGWKHLIINDHRFRRRARELQRIGNHKGDHVADEAHLALRQHRKRRLLHRQAIRAMNAPAARQRTEAVGRDIVTGQHGLDARQRQRGRLVDATDRRMAMRRTDEHAERHVGPLDVGDVIAAAGQKAEVFLAARCSANSDHVRHGYSPLPGACMAAAPASTDATMF